MQTQADRMGSAKLDARSWCCSDLPIEQLMWVEKYRPSKLEDLVDQESVKERLKRLLEKKAELPHLLFAGPPGSGKTTTAMIIARQLLGEHRDEFTLSLNASDERGIDVVRERVKTFARFADRRAGVPYRLVILDEADEMTHDGQTALRRIMEETSAFTRFILICNYSSGIIEPLQSRCAIFRFHRLDETAVTEYLKVVAKEEKLKVASESVYGAIYEATQGDLRQAINMMQAASASSELTLDAVRMVSGAAVKSRVTEIMKLALEGNFEAARLKMVELTRVYGIPERDFLKFANESLTSMKVYDFASAVSILAEYDFRLVQGSQPELQLTAMLAQLSSLRRTAE
jgi:replication factor C small subunit